MTSLLIDMDNKKITNKCWICGDDEANSREHRYKKTDLKRIFKRKDQSKDYRLEEMPFWISFDSGMSYHMKSPDVSSVKYPPLICSRCNNEKTQSMDMAYEEFSQWCWDNPEAHSIDLRKIWDDHYQQKLKDFYGYYIKILGCEILSSDLQVPLPDFFPNPLNFELNTSHLILSICKAPSMAVIHPRLSKGVNYKGLGKKSLLGSLDGDVLTKTGDKKIINLIWHRQVGNFQINFWFNIVPNSFLGFPLDGLKETYDVPVLGIDCFDMDYISNNLIFDKDYVEWLEESAAEGHPFNQYKLALKYATGDGVKQDIPKAVQLYKMAAEAGLARAQTDLGLLYFRGVGVEKDINQAVELWTLAANDGYAPAENNLGYAFQHGLGVIKNSHTAVQWYEKAANKSDSNGQYNLGFTYFDGVGVEKDFDKAIELWQIAANAGHVMAQNNLGYIYASGIVLSKNESLSIELWKKAAKKGHASAKENLRRVSKDDN